MDFYQKHFSVGFYRGEDFFLEDEPKFFNLSPATPSKTTGSTSASVVVRDIDDNYGVQAANLWNILFK